MTKNTGIIALVVAAMAMLFAQKTQAQNIQTVQLFLKGNEFSEPVYDLSQPAATLLLQFDELNSPYKYYFYTVQHCGSNWQNSRIFENDYLSGFFEQPITTYNQSVNAHQKYMHYTAELPNENFKITKTGNYKLIVYEDGNKENPIITRKFYVTSQQVPILAQAARPTQASKAFVAQELSVEINAAALPLNNAFDEITVVIQQNNRLDNMITLTQPVFIAEKRLSYTLPNDVQFEAGNEFRLLDLRTFNFRTAAVKEINTQNDLVEITLHPDNVRKNRYLYYLDADGRYFTGLIDKFSPNDPDYCYVKFSLPTTDSLAKTNQVYLLGDMCNWQLNTKSELHFNDQNAQYETTLLLKQGFYNYQYATKTADGKVSVGQYEGNFFNAQNTYCVYVYYKPLAARYQSLVGFTKIQSLR